MGFEVSPEDTDFLDPTLLTQALRPPLSPSALAIASRDEVTDVSHSNSSVKLTVRPEEAFLDYHDVSDRLKGEAKRRASQSKMGGGINPAQVCDSIKKVSEPGESISQTIHSLSKSTVSAKFSTAAGQSQPGSHFNPNFLMSTCAKKTSSDICSFDLPPHCVPKNAIRWASASSPSRGSFFLTSSKEINCESGQDISEQVAVINRNSSYTDAPTAPNHELITVSGIRSQLMGLAESFKPTDCMDEFSPSSEEDVTLPPSPEIHATGKDSDSLDQALPPDSALGITAQAHDHIVEHQKTALPVPPLTDDFAADPSSGSVIPGCRCNGSVDADQLSSRRFEKGLTIENLGFLAQDHAVQGSKPKERLNNEFLGSPECTLQREIADFQHACIEDNAVESMQLNNGGNNGDIQINQSAPRDEKKTAKSTVLNPFLRLNSPQSHEVERNSSKRRKSSDNLYHFPLRASTQRGKNKEMLNLKRDGSNLIANASGARFQFTSTIESQSPSDEGETDDPAPDKEISAESNLVIKKRKSHAPRRTRNHSPAPISSSSSNHHRTVGGKVLPMRSSRNKAPSKTSMNSAADTPHHPSQPNNVSPSLIKCNYVDDLTGLACDTRFRRPYDLARHKETIHDLEGPDGRKLHWICDECGGGFSRKDALIR